MKLTKVNKCLEVLDSIFKRDLPWETSIKVCEVMESLQSENSKFLKLADKIRDTHFMYDKNTEKYAPKSHEDLIESNNKFDVLNEKDFKLEKRKIPKFDNVSPAEYSYLKDLFDFE